MAGGGLIGDWAKAKAILDNIDANFKPAYKRALARVGAKAERALKQGMTSGAPGGQAYEPNHPFTVERKGSSKPLIDHGDFRNSIRARQFDGGVFVGVNRMARNKDGKPEVNIAAIHELGDGQGGDLYIKVTPKMRAYLHSQGLHLKSDTQFIRIPRRPTFEPVWEQNKDDWAKEFVEDVAKGTVGG
ncbi:MAG: phage virion morphogenesis protein [Patescibacteria group bacterium]